MRNERGGVMIPDSLTPHLPQVMRRQAERSLQEEIVWRLTAYQILAVPVPNSIFIPARTEQEQALVARIINRMKKTGMLLPGAPDLILAWGGDKAGSAMIELKAPHQRIGRRLYKPGEPSDNQVTFARRCAELGINYALIYSWPQLVDRLTAWGAPILTKVGYEVTKSGRD